MGDRLVDGDGDAGQACEPKAAWEMNEWENVAWCDKGQGGKMEKYLGGKKEPLLYLKFLICPWAGSLSLQRYLIED